VLKSAEQISRAWLEAYQELRPALLGHLLDEGFVDEKIRPLFPGVRVLGTAVTVRLAQGDLAPTVAAVDLLRPGDVLVIDHAGFTSEACWGELTSMAALARGCTGVIVDGAVTNVREIEAHKLPTFARAVTAKGSRRRPAGGNVNVPIQCGGVAVHPGDLVVADDDGIVIVPPPRLAEIAETARGALARAPFARAWLQKGGLLKDIVGLGAEEIQAALKARGWL